MRKIVPVLFALVTAAFVPSIAAGSAQAMPVAKVQTPIHSNAVPVGHFYHGGYGVYGGGIYHSHFHRRIYGPGVYFYSGPRFYGGGYGGCYWLKERALDTGRRYWWRRYWACRDGY